MCLKFHKSKSLDHLGGLVDWQTDIGHLATLREDTSDPGMVGLCREVLLQQPKYGMHVYTQDYLTYSHPAENLIMPQ